MRRINLSSKIINHMSIIQGTKKIYMVNIWLFLIPNLIGTHVFQAISGVPIQDIHYCLNCINLINIAKLPSLQDASCHFNNSLIFPFSYSILIWSITNNKLSSNATFFEKCKKLIRIKLSYTVSPQLLYASPTLFFNTVFKILETTKYFILFFFFF